MNPSGNKPAGDRSDLYFFTIALVLIVVIVLTAGCASREQKKPRLSYILEGSKGLALNTFSLGQGDFPILTGLEALPQEPNFNLLPEEKAIELLNAAFAEHGHRLTAGYSFNWGKAHVRLDGFDKESKVGYIFVSLEDYEDPILPADHSPAVRSIFYTHKSPVRVSAPELLLLEQLNQQERIHLALINAHQFASPAGADKAAVEKMIKRLKSRINLYLMWIDARLSPADAKGQSEH